MTEMKEKVLEYISQGDTAQALDALIRGLSATSAPGNAALLRTARLIEAEFSRLREEQLANTIDPDAASARLNDINRRILDLLETAGKAQQHSIVRSERTKWLLGIGILALVLLLLFGKPIWKWAGELIAPPPPPPEPEAPYTCPAFNPGKKLKIAVLPFLNVQSGQDLPLHLGLQDELNALINRVRYSGQAETASGNPARDYLNFDDAEQLRLTCDADMVIWGKYTSSGAREPRIDIRFVSPAIALPQQEELDSLLEHRTQAELSSNLKTSALLLLAQAFLAEAEYDLALRLASQAIGPVPEGEEEPAAQADAHIIIAEAYQMMGNSERATESYKKALSIEPGNAVALNNKVVLDLKAQRFEEAQSQLSKAIEVYPESKRLETLRKKIAALPPGDTALPKAILRDLRRLRQIDLDSAALPR